MENLEWVDKSACADMNPDIFFPKKGDYRTLMLAKSICADCVVKEECLEYAIKTRASGVYGGTSEKQRRQIIHERNSSRQNI